MQIAFLLPHVLHDQSRCVAKQNVQLSGVALSNVSFIVARKHIYNVCKSRINKQRSLLLFSHTHTHGRSPTTSSTANLILNSCSSVNLITDW